MTTTLSFNELISSRRVFQKVIIDKNEHMQRNYE